MAKILNFRAWLLYDKMTNFYIGKSSSQNAIDYSQYESISLYEHDSVAADWISYEYNASTVYISQYVIFYNMNYDEALFLCEKIGNININGKPYSAKIMPASFWLDLPKDVYTILHAYQYSFITSTFNNEFYHVVSRDSYSNAFNYTGYVDENSISEGAEEKRSRAFIPVLVPVNNEVFISGEDLDLGDKSSSFSITYTVHDEDHDDSIYITEELNNKIIREIANAECDTLYTFSITPGLYSDLIENETNVIKITANDGYVTASRFYTFKKVSNNPIITYDGNPNLGSIPGIPELSYTVSDNNEDSIIVTEKLNGKVIHTETVSSGTARTIEITESQWLECIGVSTLEIVAENSSGGSSTFVITFARDNGNRLEVRTKPSVSSIQPSKISLNVGWTTDNATGTVYVANNALDENVEWEDATNEIENGEVYFFENSTKTSDNWAVSIKIVIEKDEGSTSEVNVFSIRGTYE